MPFIKKEQAIKEMMDYCIENNVTEFHILADYAKENQYKTWFRYLVDDTEIMVDFINDLKTKSNK